MSLRLRLLLVIILVATLLSVLSVSTGTYLAISELKEEALKQNEKDLQAKRYLVTQRIESYFSHITLQIKVMAANLATIEATQGFVNAFHQYPEHPTLDPSLIQYYEKTYVDVYRAQNIDDVDVAPLIQELDGVGRSLQAAFIAKNSYPVGEKDKLTRLVDGSDYDDIHNRYHGGIRHFQKSFGFYDIFIVSPDTGHIVYSVFKELDYATSLKTGPYKDSAIAKAFKKALLLNEGEVHLTDFMPYLPSYNNPASFISTPIFDKGKRIGVLIFQMPIDKINELMTQNEEWESAGFGKSGEVYLVGNDKTLRNESRFFVEDRHGYLGAIRQAGIEEHKVIEQKETAIGLQPVSGRGVAQALAGQSGFDVFNDYRGVPVLSSYGPVVLPSQQWAMMSEIDEEEALSSVSGIATSMITGSVIIVVLGILIAAFVAVVLAKRLTMPLDELNERLHTLSQGDADLTLRVSDSGIAEIDAIGQSFNRFVSQLQSIMTNVKDAIITIASSGTELAASFEQAKTAIHEQNVKVQSVTRSLNDFSESVTVISDQTKGSFESTEDASTTTSENAQHAQKAVTNIEQLVEEVTTSASIIEKLQNNVKDINDVLTLIDAIADQTNLLALNAAIEAARAGDHGRGFAVVADEVRTLAARTQESTVNIQNQIGELTASAGASVNSMTTASNSAQEGIQLVQTVDDNLQHLQEVVDALARTNEVIANSTTQQSNSIETIRHDAIDLEGRFSELSQAIDAIAAVAEQLSQTSEDVKENVDRFVV